MSPSSPGTMPAIKKKWIKANQEVHEAESNENNDELAGGDVGDVAVKGNHFSC